MNSIQRKLFHNYKADRLKLPKKEESHDGMQQKSNDP
jgi:hypothetical protein